MQHVEAPADAVAIAAEPTVWTTDSRKAPLPYAIVPLTLMLRRGLLCRCPVCGAGRLFAHGLLRVVPVCASCQAPLGAVRADDAPPYFTIFIVAHLVVGLLVAMEHVAMLSVAAEMAIFLPITLALTLGLMRPVKGATIALMLKLGLVTVDGEGAGAGHA